MTAAADQKYLLFALAPEAQTGRAFLVAVPIVGARLVGLQLHHSLAGGGAQAVVNWGPKEARAERSGDAGLQRKGRQEGGLGTSRPL